MAGINSIDIYSIPHSQSKKAGITNVDFIALYLMKYGPTKYTPLRNALLRWRGINPKRASRGYLTNYFSGAPSSGRYRAYSDGYAGLTYGFGVRYGPITHNWRAYWWKPETSIRTETQVMREIPIYKDGKETGETKSIPQLDVTMTPSGHHNDPFQLTGRGKRRATLVLKTITSLKL